jgi:hypothetical protein
MPQPGGCVKMPQPGGCVKKWATTGRLSKKPGGCVKKTKPGVVKKVETGRLRQKKSKPGGCVKKVETGRLRQKNARSRPKKVETARLRQKNARSRPKKPKTPGCVQNARSRPFSSPFPSFLSLSCSNHQYIHHQSLLCAQYCTLNAKECQKNETTPQTFMK